MKNRNPKPILLEGWALLVMLMSMLIPWAVAGGRKHDWSAPLAYSGDALFSLQMIKRMVEGGWFFDTFNQGYPGHSNMLDFPAADFGLYVVQKFLGVILGDAALVFNVFFLLGFVLAGMSAYWVLRRMKVAPHVAFAGALSFAVAPYHFARIGHLMLSWYFVVPLFVYQALRLMGAVGEDGAALTSRRRWGLLISAFCLGLFGVYYAFFGAMLLFTSGVISSIAKRGLGFRFAAASCAMVFLAVVACVTPTLLNNHFNGKNKEVVHRFPNETEVYAIKIAQLILPPANHRVRFMAKTTGHYNDDFPLINENRFSALGVAGSIGLLMLIFHVMRSQFLPEENRLKQALAFLLLVMLLMSTVGGFSTLFAIHVSPMIRAWNRISMFIGFVSLGMLALWVTNRNWSAAGGVKGGLFTLAVVAFVVIDQTPKDFSALVRSQKAMFLSDRTFVRQVESKLPARAAVLTLPYMYFPEGPSLHKMETYDPGRAYLHSSQIRWSYGGIKGRDADLQFKRLAALGADEMVRSARSLGYAGVYVDRFGYADQGRSIEADLRAVLGVVPIESPDRRFFFMLL